MWGCFLMSGVKILHFLKDWWKSIPIHQNYTMALNSTEHGFKLDSYDINLYIDSNTISIRFGNHTQKLVHLIFGAYSIIFVENFLDVHSNQMKIVKTGYKMENNAIRNNQKIVETIFWHWLAYGMRMVLKGRFRSGLKGASAIK